MYMALKAETTENVAVIPNVFIPFISHDITTQYKSNASVPIIGSRVLNINPIKDIIEAPSGTVKVQAEPKTFGYFLKAVFGAVTSGRYFPISSVTGTFTVGETVTGGTSAATATVLAVSAEGDYLIMGSPTGTFTAAGEALTGGSSGATATLGVNAGTVYGHEFKGPQDSLPTFTVEFGYDDMAFRFTGVRFNGFNSISHDNNIITAEINMFARAEFKHARVTAAVTSGSGAKTIPLDQTTGLVATDSIKVFRPSTGAFLDFSASSVKTHTVGTIPGETSITVTDLQTALAVGDLVVLAPLTPSYSVERELAWIGASVARLSTTPTLALAASAASIEEFELSIMNEMEGRHAANGTNVVNRFPAKNHLKKLSLEGSIKKAYLDQTYLDIVRNATAMALQVRHTGRQIASTGVYYTLDWRLPNLIFRPHNPNPEEDNVLDEEMSFDGYLNSAYTAKTLLVNDNTAY